MSQEIINVLNYLGEQLGIAIDWSSENVWPQVIDILGRYRLFELITTSIWLLVEIIMLICALVIFKKMFNGFINLKKNNESNFWWQKGYCSNYLTGFGTAIMLIGICCAVFGIIGAVVDIEEIFKWLIVPEIQYLEMLKGLMP
jgi:flagellar biosynthesis protein FlhB